MSTPSDVVSDSATMLRRHLRHMLRYPSLTVTLVGLPLVFLVLFGYVFGATLVGYVWATKLYNRDPS